MKGILATFAATFTPPVGNFCHFAVSEALTSTTKFAPPSFTDSQAASHHIVDIIKDSSAAWQDDLFVSYSKGTISEHSDFIGSEKFFSLPAGSFVFARYRNGILYYPSIAFYDSAFNYISGERPVLSSVEEQVQYRDMNGYFYNVPAHAQYFRVAYEKHFARHIEIYIITPPQSETDIPSTTNHIPLSPIDGKTVVCFGDSIIGMHRGDDSVPAYISAETGAIVHNAGFGGCRMAEHPSFGYGAFSMWALAKAVTSGDWTEQDIQAAAGSKYFPEQLASLKAIDFSTVDMAVIHYGTNDFTAGNRVPIDNDAAPYDCSTMCGALRYSIEALLGKYPYLRIFISLPCYRFWTDENGNTIYPDSYTNKLGYLLQEYVESLICVAKEYNLPVIDSYHDLGINKVNAKAFLEDGTHHNAAGRERLGRLIGAHLAAQHGSISHNG